MLLGLKGLGKEEALQEIQDFKQRHAATNCAELLAMAKEIEQKHIPIIAGFQGIGEHKEITTLKRGGSDVSAVFIADQLGADHVEMIKDVDGVYNKDPNKSALEIEVKVH